MILWNILVQSPWYANLMFLAVITWNANFYCIEFFLYLIILQSTYRNEFVRPNFWIETGLCSRWSNIILGLNSALRINHLKRKRLFVSLSWMHSRHSVFFKLVEWISWMLVRHFGWGSVMWKLYFILTGRALLQWILYAKLNITIVTRSLW